MSSHWMKLLVFGYYLLNIAISSFASNIPQRDDTRLQYLNRQHPLWILEDQVSSMERDISQITFTTTATPQFPSYYLKYRRKKTVPQEAYFSRKLSKSPGRISLPSSYTIYPNHKNHSRKSYGAKRERHTSWRRQQPLSIPLESTSMPIFDSVPNNIDATDDAPPPVFIYNGPKGELIMNTMLSTHKYPMQEPIPGEILYPPMAPIFCPKPIVQRFRVPGREETMNLTLIPFYAHEAIVPRLYYDYTMNGVGSVHSAEVAESNSGLSSSAVIYETAAVSPITSITSTAAPKHKKKRKHKKSKHYAVYHSPDEVNWRPTEPPMEHIPEATTSFPMVLANPLQNHRYREDAMNTPTTINPNNNQFQLTYKDEDSNFRIVYVDESLENPISREVTPTRVPSLKLKNLPVLSSHYTTEKEYYAFPVYTLGKLLKPNDSVKPLPYSTYFPYYDHSRNSAEKSVDTWFILNSKYKGPRSKDGPKLLSSKYVEVPNAAANEKIIEGSAVTTF